MLIRKPAFTAVVVLTLALGIGANTAIFSVVDAVLLRPLPFPGADRLALITGSKPRQGWPELPLSLPNFTDIKDTAKSFEGMAAWIASRINISGGEPEQVQSAIVSSSLFSVLGVAPALGRSFSLEEDQQGIPPVAILSHSLWQRRFGSDPGLVGRTITLDGRSHEVIGILPPGFRFLGFPGQTEVWLPFGLDPMPQRKYARGLNALGAVARLRKDATLRQARADLEIIAGRLQQAHPDINAGLGLSVVPLQEKAARKLRTSLLVLLAAVGFVLLIACANVANLVLVRATARHREIAIRAALGAGRLRLVCQILTENLVLSVAGGAAGLLVASWAVDLMALMPYGGPDFYTPYSVSSEQVGLDGRVLLFTFGLSILTGLVSGIAPALQVSSSDPNESLRDSRAVPAPGGRRLPVRSALVVSEIALSLMLLIGAGLMIRSFVRLQHVDPGFHPENVLTMDVNLPKSRYPEDHQVAAFYSRLLERVRNLPGVASAGVVEYLPLSGLDASTGFIIEGQAPPAQAEMVHTHYRSISPDYFRAMGIRLLKGRDFSTQESGRVAIINDAMAHRFFPGGDPIGKRLALNFEAMKFFNDRPPEMDLAGGLREIVGIVSDIKHAALDAESVPEMYVPYPQRSTRSMTLVLRADSDPERLAGAVRSQVLSMDKDQPVSNVNTMAGLISTCLAQPRFNVLLLTLFAGVAIALALVGIHGVVSYSVTIRAREIGIRMALGARASDVAGLVVREGLVLALIGTAIGTAGALALTHLMRGLLFEVSAADPVTYAVLPLLLVALAAVSSFVPAWRAARADPMSALRCE